MNKVNNRPYINNNLLDMYFTVVWPNRCIYELSLMSVTSSSVPTSTPSLYKGWWLARGLEGGGLTLSYGLFSPGLSRIITYFMALITSQGAGTPPSLCSLNLPVNYRS